MATAIQRTVLQRRPRRAAAAASTMSGAVATRTAVAITGPAISGAVIGGGGHRRAPKSR